MDENVVEKLVVWLVAPSAVVALLHLFGGFEAGTWIKAIGLITLVLVGIQLPCWSASSNAT
jgi:hypothetical protein